MLVIYADAPLLRAETLRGLRGGLAEGAGLVALGFEAADPTGYGRLVERDGALIAIREQKDANEAERAIRRCNAGPMAISGARALELLDAVARRQRRARILSHRPRRDRRRQGPRRRRRAWPTKRR